MDDEEVGLPAEVISAAESVFRPEDEAAEASVRSEMHTMYQRDAAMAVLFVVLLVVTIPFTVIALWQVMPDSATKVVLIASGAVLLVYNIASMLNLVRNYRRDKDFIYRRDVAHLREIKVVRQLKRRGEAAA
ncbi:MAG: hypothetical protein ACR2J5_14630 [Geodermatophilaceae bacterium]